jgi:hypothetical protein
MVGINQGYDLGINHHPGKANVVADTLSRRSHLNILATRELLLEVCKEFEKLNHGWVSNIEVIMMEVDLTMEQDIERANLRMLSFKRSRNKLRKIKLYDLVLMSREHDGARSIYVFQK